MPEKDKSGTEEEIFNLYCIQGGNMGGNSMRPSRNHLFSARIVQKRLKKSTRLLNDLKNHGNQILIFSSEKNVTVDPVIDKQNGRVVTFWE